MKVYFDPLDVACKSITGATSDRQSINIKIEINKAKQCFFSITSDDGEQALIKMQKQGKSFSLLLSPRSVGLYWYHFIADGKKIGKGKFGFAEEGEYTGSFELLVYPHGQSYPKSFCGGIMYQIFPDRFNKAKGYGDASGKRIRSDWGVTPEYKPRDGKMRNDDFFGGNFEGIRQKLDYLSRLNVTKVYLNPIFEAKSNHRYDTGDYMRFDPLLGNDEDFANMISDGKKRDISFIIDGVFNHTGDDSVYFNKYGSYPTVGAYNSKNSPYYKWFTFQNFPDEYTSWWGIDTLPTVNKESLEYEEFITGENGVLDRCLKLGVDGVRLDVVDEIPDSFVKKITSRVKSYGNEKIVIGEVWEDATNKIAYGVRRRYFQGGELDSVMNYPLKNAIIDFVINGNPDCLYATVREQIDNYPAHSLSCMMNILGTHDTPRILTVLGKQGKIKSDRAEMEGEILSLKEYELAKKMLKCASLLQFTLYGVPCIYYGDEIGMQGNKDPFNRRCFDWKYGDREILDWYKTLGKLRSKNSLFKEGKTVEVGKDKGVFYFTRDDGIHKMAIVINCGNEVVDAIGRGYKKEITRNVKHLKIPLNKYDFAIFYK